jgi:hypothetical protein
LEFAALEFESANPTIVKSIKQRDLLNTWLRLYAREQLLPRLEEYRPSRIEEELPDLVFFVVESTQPPRLIIESDGTRMSRAYGHSGKGRYLEEYLGARLAPLVMPIYHLQCRRHLRADRRLRAPAVAVLERRRRHAHHRLAENHLCRRQF